MMDPHYFITLLIGIMFYVVDGKMDKDLQCAVCRALVDEVNYGISQVDPKKTVQVGSFRVDGKGNQNTYKKPYARSEIHLTDLFENICDKFSQYALTKNSKGAKSVIPTSSRTGKTISLKDVTISSEGLKQIKYICETLVEDYEDDMIKVLGQVDVNNYEKQICCDQTEVCSEEDMEVPMPSPDSKYRDAEENKDEDVDDDDEEEKEDEKDDAQEETEETQKKEEL